MGKTSKVVRKNMRLRQDLIDRARRILGTRTETETVEQALELVTFREEVLAGIESIAGTNAVEDVLRDEPG
ncbi:MAG: type II toxin-antitoxin system VapB family antitoxin [Dehalococcoidia bacterium]